jgi:cell division initiation protein
MIDLTPLEVRQKKGDFRRAMRGYDAELVNDFLDLVADRMEELVKDNMNLRDSVQSLETEVTKYREKERALSDALMAAQRLRDDARSHAEKEGELMVREARLAAESAREEATRALAREEEALRQARARRSQMIESFRRLLERELGELEVIEKALELKGKGGAGATPSRKGAAKSQARTRTDEPTATGAADGSERGGEGGEGAAGAGEAKEDWLSSLVEE